MCCKVWQGTYPPGWEQNKTLWRQTIISEELLGIQQSERCQNISFKANVKLLHLANLRMFCRSFGFWRFVPYLWLLPQPTWHISQRMFSDECTCEQKRFHRLWQINNFVMWPGSQLDNRITKVDQDDMWSLWKIVIWKLQDWTHELWVWPAARNQLAFEKIPLAFYWPQYNP